MSNNVKLENPLYGISLTLAERVIIDSKNASASDSNFISNQSFIAGNNAVTHNLNKYCSVTVVDNNDNVVIGEIRYNSLNQVTLTFTAAFTGKAFFN